jgi:4-amino-4-deoxy-L-arabinose transferase-like glycosyltransferase
MEQNGSSIDLGVGVALVTLFTLLLHLPGLRYGLPFWLVNDELPLVGGALRMVQLHNPIPSMNPVPMEILYYPPGLPWLYLVVWTPVLGVQWALAGFPSIAEFANQLVTHLAPIWITSRLISVAFLAGTVWMVMRLSADVLRDRRAALAAGLLIATSFHHAILGQFARVWEPTAFFFWWGLWACWRIYSTGDRRAYLWAALAAGLGFAINYVGVLVSLGVALAHIARHRRIVIDRALLLHAAIVAVFIVVILASSWPNFVRLLGFSTVVSEHAPESGSLSLFYARIMLKSDPFLLLIGVVGLPLLWRRAKVLIGLYCVIFIPYAATILTGTGFDDRYTVPLTPLLAISGGALVTLAMPRLKRLAFAAVACVIIVQSVLLIRLADLMHRDDTRQLARLWATEHVTPGQGVLVALRGMTFEQTLQSVEFERNLAPNVLTYLQRQRLAGAKTESGGGGPEINAIDIRRIGPVALRKMPPEQLLGRLTGRNYHWLLIDNLSGPIGDGSLERDLLKRAELVETITPDHGVAGPNFNLTDQFSQGAAMNVLWMNRLGPTVKIYRFN